jgi:hypothetical protein
MRDSGAAMADQLGPTRADADPPSRDHLTAGPIIIALVLSGLFFFSTYASNNFDRYGSIGLFALFFAFVAVITNLVLLMIRLGKRRWRASISVAVALGILVVCFFTRNEILFGMDYIRFQVFRDHYVSALTRGADPASAKGPRVLNWGFWGYFLSGEIYRKLIYDETDEIITPDGLRSARIEQAIQATMENSIIHCKTSVRGVEGHFYLVDIAC